MAIDTQVATLKVAGAETTSTTQAGVKFKNVYKEALILLNVISAATVVGDTLDVYIDTSPDGGTTWLNVGHFTQVLGNGGAKKFVMAQNPANAGVSAIADVTVDATVGVTRQFGIGDRLRSRSVIAGTGSFNYSVTASLK